MLWWWCDAKRVDTHELEIDFRDLLWWRTDGDRDFRRLAISIRSPLLLSYICPQYVPGQFSSSCKSSKRRREVQRTTHSYFSPITPTLTSPQPKGQVSTKYDTEKRQKRNIKKLPGNEKISESICVAALGKSVSRKLVLLFSPTSEKRSLSCTTNLLSILCHSIIRRATVSHSRNENVRREQRREGRHRLCVLLLRSPLWPRCNWQEERKAKRSKGGDANAVCRVVMLK